MTGTNWTGLLCAVGMLVTIAGPAAAQDQYPSKPVRIIVPTGAGGANDVVLLSLREKFSQITGQEMIIENRAGASGTIAADAVLRSAPDGYTLLAAIPTVLSLNPHVMANPPYDAEKSFIPVTQLLTTNYYFLAGATVPAKTIPELVAHAKANPGKVSFGSAGLGSTSHLLMEMLGHSAGVEFLHVPYRGASLAAKGMITGEIDTTISAMEGMKEFISAGKARILAVASAARTPVYPDVPTFAELGHPRVMSDLWMGLVAPAGTPPSVIEKLHAVIAQALKYPDLRQRWEAIDQEVVGSSPAEFAAFLSADRARWGEAIKATGFKLKR